MILSLNTYPSFCYTVSDCLPAAIVVMPQQQQQSASYSATPPAALLNTAAGFSSSAGSASKAPLTRSLSHVLSASVSRELSLHAASAAGVTSPAATSAGLLSIYPTADPTPPILK